MLLLEGQAQSVIGDYAGGNSKQLFDNIENDKAKFQSLATNADRYWGNEIQSYLRLTRLVAH
jgi:hypothetical protein